MSGFRFAIGAAIIAAADFTCNVWHGKNTGLKETEQREILEQINMEGGELTPQQEVQKENAQEKIKKLMKLTIEKRLRVPCFCY